MSDDSLQSLPKSLREKQRYLVFDIICEQDREIGQVVDAVWESMLELLGESGVAKADPWVLEDLFDSEAQRGGMKVNRDAVHEVRAALTLVQEIGGEKAALKVLGVTGTMDSARKKYV